MLQNPQLSRPAIAAVRRKESEATMVLLTEIVPDFEADTSLGKTPLPARPTFLGRFRQTRIVLNFMLLQATSSSMITSTDPGLSFSATLPTTRLCAPPSSVRLDAFLTP